MDTKDSITSVHGVQESSDYKSTEEVTVRWMIFCQAKPLIKIRKK